MASPNAQSLIVESSIVKLIEEIEQRPALYNTSLKEYSDANIKKRLWEEVCEAVIADWNQLSAEDKTIKGRDVQKKWANLRTCFRRELNAQKNTKSGQAMFKRRTYVYFEQLLFLLPCIENRLTEGILEKDKSQENDDDDDDDQVGPSTSILIRKRKKKPHASNHADLNETLLKTLNGANTDEDVNFALSLVPSLQHLTAIEKLDAKISILNVFKQIRLARCVLANSQSNYRYNNLPPTTNRYIVSLGNSNESNGSECSDVSQTYDL